jgi:hypothetical protein
MLAPPRAAFVRLIGSINDYGRTFGQIAQAAHDNGRTIARQGDGVLSRFARDNGELGLLTGGDAQARQAEFNRHVNELAAVYQTVTRPRMLWRSQNK